MLKYKTRHSSPWWTKKGPQDQDLIVLPRIKMKNHQAHTVDGSFHWICPSRITRLKEEEHRSNECAMTHSRRWIYRWNAVIKLYVHPAPPRLCNLVRCYWDAFKFQCWFEAVDPGCRRFWVLRFQSFNSIPNNIIPRVLGVPLDVDMLSSLLIWLHSRLHVIL